MHFFWPFLQKLARLYFLNLELSTIIKKPYHWGGSVRKVG